MTTTEPQWKVGDEVIVTGKWVRNGRTTISKVGRKYFYLDGDKREIPYEISGGWAKRDQYGSGSRVRTPEQYEADEVRSKVLSQLSAHGVRWSDQLLGNVTWMAGNLTTARLHELLHFVQQIAEELPHHDLDRN